MKKEAYLHNLGDFQPKTNKTTNIYFIVAQVSKKEWHNRVKIGLAKNVKTRLACLSIGCPHNLNLWYSFKVDENMGRRLESELHKKFRWSRTKGEWFYIHPYIRKWVKAHKEMMKPRKELSPEINPTWIKRKTTNGRSIRIIRPAKQTGQHSTHHHTQQTG